MTPTSPPVALVTGGGSGIGRAVALRLARDGWRVLVADCRPDAAELVAQEVSSVGGNGVSLELDVADPEAWQAGVEKWRARWPRLDLLVNSAGVLTTGTLDQTPAAELHRVIHINLLGTMFGCQACAEWLREGSHAAPPLPYRGILNIASIFAVVSPPGFGAYNASKAGVVAFSETLRGELAASGVNVTVVLPGITPTPLFQQAVYASVRHRQACERFVQHAELTPEGVAEQALKGVAQRRPYLVIGRRARLYSWLKRIAPGWLLGRLAARAEAELGSGSPPHASTRATSDTMASRGA